MFVPGLIERKRDGGALAPGEWRDLVSAYHAGTVPDYQMAALLMAVFLRGMTREETAALLDAMVASGRRLDLGHLGQTPVGLVAGGVEGQRLAEVRRGLDGVALAPRGGAGGDVGGDVLRRRADGAHDEGGGSEHDCAHRTHSGWGRKA